MAQQNIPPVVLIRNVAIAIIVVAVIAILFGGFYIVSPGNRGVAVTLGKVDTDFRAEGTGFKLPLMTSVHEVSIRQQTRESTADCYSSDLQPIKMKLKVLYRVPEGKVVSIFQQYAGDPFDSLIAPRVQEALKEYTALQTAEQIVKQREHVKTATVDAARRKIGELILLEDVVIENIDLSDQLEQAIESKMVQEQEASKSKFTQDKARIEAETSIIKAEAEAKSIRIKGEALRETPDLINLQIVEKWDGRAPLVVGGGSGTSILLPIDLKQMQATPPRE